MRIAFISTAFDQQRGGAGVFANLFRHIGSHHDIVVISRDGDTDPAWRTAQVSSRYSHSYYWFTEHQFITAALRRFQTLHEEEPFDLIMVNQVIGSRVAELKTFGIPVVYMIHHPISVDITLALQESTTLRERLSWRLAYGFMESIQRKLVHTLDIICTVSESARDRIASDYAIPKEKISVIHNGIDTNFFHRTRPAEAKTVIALGSYQHPRRGFPYLIQAYRQLSKAGFSILDVGRRTDEQYALIKAIPRVTSYELVDSKDIPDLYSRASVAMSTSLYEGFGLAIAEALACETPCVAFAAGGVNDLLGRIDPTLLCPVGDVATLVAKAEAVSTIPAPHGYREAVIRDFSLDVMAQRYEAFFRDLKTHP